ncbi:hypothetical protein BDV12DRAFT_193508 [Aspergillus spectabilis]
MQNEISQFSSTFAPQLLDETGIWKIIIDAITIDITNAAVSSFAFSTTKDSFESQQDALNTQNSISASLGIIFDSWEEILVNYVDTLFSGTMDDGSIPTLQDLLSRVRLWFSDPGYPFHTIPGGVHSQLDGTNWAAFQLRIL